MRRNAKQPRIDDQLAGRKAVRDPYPYLTNRIRSALRLLEGGEGETRMLGPIKK